jgi:putative tryptophan/tyrosine transport system substrate-binding protein
MRTMIVRGVIASMLALGLGGVVAAQTPPRGKVYRVAHLSISPYTTPGLAPLWTAFQEGMRALGYIEGQNLQIETRFSEGREDRHPALVAELIRWQPDVIMAVGTAAALAAKAATSTIPIVMVGVSEPEKFGLIVDLRNPGGNITGVINQLEDMRSKQYELLRKIIPGLFRVAVLWNPDNPSSALSWEDAQRRWGPTFGFELVSVPIRSAADLAPAFATIAEQRVGALEIHVVLLQFRAAILEFAAAHGLPTIAAHRAFVESGALLSFAPSFTDIYRRSAAFVDKVLKGAKPADLPVEQPTKFELVINLRIARSLGLTITPELLVQADEVIE